MTICIGETQRIIPNVAIEFKVCELVSLEYGTWFFLCAPVEAHPSSG